MGAFTGDHRIFAPRHVLGWTLFTLSTGLVNAGAVMACKNFVTHITGSITNLATDTPLASKYVLVVALFFAGAMVGVLMAEMLKARPKIAFASPVLVAFVMLLAIALGGKAGAFGAFGRDELDQHSFAMLGLLAAAMGMVNASIAAATANQVRVTHLTGPATDLAGNIVRAALGAGKGSAIEARWAMLRSAKLGSFVVGAALAVKLADDLQYDVFSLAAGILIVALGFTGAPEQPSEHPPEEVAKIES